MPKALRIKKTFNLKKLANKLDKIIVDDLNVLGSSINKAIIDGINSGKDIHGNSFKDLEPITKVLGGSKPLNRTGNMHKTKKIPATRSKKIFAIHMAGKSKKGRYYGAYHNTGFIQTNEKQWFYGSKVPKREWFGIPKTMYPGQPAYEKATVGRRLRIRSAFKK
ncbi:MAG: hypothetical protein Unbinned4234contig1003_4 [Prokaryotic dsDNA virus sp.]|nr:MAG: hypothetical protein Unbinned4234contig1003_4 [Prokaryotic dsDNA virus sp.]